MYILLLLLTAIAISSKGGAGFVRGLIMLVFGGVLLLIAAAII